MRNRGFGFFIRGELMGNDRVLERIFSLFKEGCSRVEGFVIKQNGVYSLACFLEREQVLKMKEKRKE